MGDRKLNRIIYIDERLKEIAEEAKVSSEAMKNYLRSGYKAFLNEKKAILKRAEKEESLINQDILPLDNAKKV